MTDVKDNTEEDANPESMEDAANVDVSSLIKQLDVAQQEAQRSKDEYLRALADLENYRRRALRDREELRKSITGRMVEEFLPVMDNLALGLGSAPKHGADKSVIDGFQMVLDQMCAVLKEHGLQEVNPEGEAFDPNLHECMSLVVDPQVPENNVIQVVRLGYTLQGRLLRPASVIVSRGPKEGGE